MLDTSSHASSLHELKLLFITLYFYSVLETHTKKKKGTKIMEIITVNGVKYDTITILTSANSISFTLIDGNITTLKNFFKDTTSLSISDSETPDIIYGKYKNLSFESISEDVNGRITVTMHIPTALELAIVQLQSSQVDQDEAIAELYGTEV